MLGSASPVENTWAAQLVRSRLGMRQQGYKPTFNLGPEVSYETLSFVVPKRKKINRIDEDFNEE